MAAICAEGLGFGYSDRVTILEQVRFRLTKGWYGLVGANGSGKTTLARLIQGTLEPSNGKLWLEPASASVVLCDQDINALPDGLRHFANREDRESCRWRGLMQLDIASLERWSTLSPGERKRWQIAAALSELPDVLIVDEPTNHLDAEARRHVIDALRRHMGVGIAVSHDRELLREVTSQTLRVHRGRVELYPGSYLKARALWQAATQSTIEARAQSIERRDTLQKRVAEAARMKEAASRNRSAKVRMKSRHDHDATSMVAAGRAANGEARISRSLHVIEAKLERASESIPEFIVDKTLGRSLFVGYQPAPQARILGLEGENVQVGGKTILYEVRISFGRHARVHLKGPNGSGKSTLIAALRARAGAIAERCLWLAQAMTSAEVRELSGAVGALPHHERGRLMQILAALGTDPERLMASNAPSPGEARKLSLAFGLATHAVALILDEPTNHLDLPSIERLEAALAAFPGAILLVSHDPAFAEACTSESWEIRESRVWR